MPNLHYLLPAGKSDLFSLMYVRVFVRVSCHSREGESRRVLKGVRDKNSSVCWWCFSSSDRRLELANVFPKTGRAARAQAVNEEPPSLSASYMWEWGVLISGQALIMWGREQEQEIMSIYWFVELLGFYSLIFAFWTYMISSFSSLFSEIRT